MPTLDPLLAGRRSGRAYDSQRPVSSALLRTLLEAARWAPSCYGDQPWNYIICRRDDGTTAWQNALDCLSPGNQNWARNAPLLLLAIALRDFRSRPASNRWGDYDTGAASMAICLQAASLGMMAHQMGGFDKDVAQHTFAVPDSCDIMAFIALGYPLPENKIPEQLLQAENKPRERMPLDNNFFTCSWGQKLEL